MKFIVNVPDKDFEHANWEGVNRQMIAAFIREELQGCGGGYHPDDWKWGVLRHVTVKAEVSS